MDAMQGLAPRRGEYLNSSRVLRFAIFLLSWMVWLSAVNLTHARVVDAPEVAIPAWHAPVTDVANVLDPAQMAWLHFKLIDLQAQRGVHPSVLIVPGTGPQSVERFASAVFDRWTLGAEGRDHGLLLLIAVDQRRMRIASGPGLVARMPGEVASRISDELVKPLLGDENYFSGIDAAIDALAVQFGGPLAERPEVAATPLAFAGSSIVLPTTTGAARFTVYDMAGFALLVVVLGVAAYRWRTMRLCSIGLAVLAGAVTVTDHFGSEALIHGVTGIAALGVGLLVLVVTMAGMRRALAKGLRDFGLRWLAVLGLTAAMAWQANGSLIPVAITALLAMLFAFMPTKDSHSLSRGDDRDNGDLPEGW